MTDHLKAYTFHGIEFGEDTSPGTEEGELWYQTTCPFCDKENHFHVSDKTGQFNCKVCGDNGNLYTFLNLLPQLSRTGDSEYPSFSLVRDVPDYTLKSWGWFKSYLTGEWMLPVRNNKGKIANVFKAYTTSEGWRVIPSPKPCVGWPFTHPSTFHNETAETWSFSADLKSDHKILKQASPNSYALTFVCEGPWDTMALWSLLLACVTQKPKVSATGNSLSRKKSRSKVYTAGSKNPEPHKQLTKLLKTYLPWLGEVFIDLNNREIGRSILRPGYVSVVGVPGAAQHNKAKSWLPFLHPANNTPTSEPSGTTESSSSKNLSISVVGKTIFLFDNDYHKGRCKQCKTNIEKSATTSA